MRTLITCPLSWTMFYLGRAFFILCDRCNLGFCYRPWQWLMQRSLDVQLWGGDVGPWYKNTE